MRSLDVVPPTQNELFDDLKALRRAGLMRLTEGRFHALEQAARTAGRIETDETVGPYVVERMLRDAVAKIGSDLGDAAALSFGLQDGGRSDKTSQLRLMAAETMHVTKEHYRHHYEPLIFRQTAHLMLAEVHDHRLRLGRLRDEARTPVGSRLAVEWLTRFEAMYAIWSPLTGVGGDLSASRATLQEAPNKWKSSSDPDDPESQGYSPEIQAQGYITNALYYYSVFLCCLKEFEVRFGGLWLLPEAGAETDLASAVRQVVLASPNNERDDSYLRLLMGGAKGSELHEFLRLLAKDEIAMSIHAEWQEWANACQCQWTPGDRRGREMFPAAANHAGIERTCELHRVVSACSDFCLILNDAWDQVADWYTDVNWPARSSSSAEELYVEGQSETVQRAPRSTS